MQASLDGTAERSRLGAWAHRLLWLACLVEKDVKGNEG